MVGTVDEVKNSTNERVYNLLNRVPEDDNMDMDKYLQRLTGVEVQEETVL